MATSGVIKAGWHCGSVPGGNGCTHQCDNKCEYCNNNCNCVLDPDKEGKSPNYDEYPCKVCENGVENDEEDGFRCDVNNACLECKDGECKEYEPDNILDDFFFPKSIVFPKLNFVLFELGASVRKYDMSVTRNKVCCAEKLGRKTCSGEGDGTTEFESEASEFNVPLAFIEDALISKLGCDASEFLELALDCDLALGYTTGTREEFGTMSYSYDGCNGDSSPTFTGSGFWNGSGIVETIGTGAQMILKISVGGSDLINKELSFTIDAEGDFVVVDNNRTDTLLVSPWTANVPALGVYATLEFGDYIYTLEPVDETSKFIGFYAGGLTTVGTEETKTEEFTMNPVPIPCPD